LKWAWLAWPERRPTFHIRVNSTQVCSPQGDILERFADRLPEDTTEDVLAAIFRLLEPRQKGRAVGTGFDGASSFFLSTQMSAGLRW
jgi:hypothetical protein